MAGIDPGALGFLVADISRLIRLSMDRANARNQSGVTPGEARVLAFAARSGPVRQMRLAGMIGLEAMTISGHLDALEAKGLVTREADPDDRRAKLVHLTPAAGPVLEAIAETGLEIRAIASAGITEAQWERLKADLMMVRANLAEANGCAGDE